MKKACSTIIIAVEPWGFAPQTQPSALIDCRAAGCPSLIHSLSQIRCQGGGITALRLMTTCVAPRARLGLLLYQDEALEDEDGPTHHSAATQDAKDNTYDHALVG